PARAGWEVPTAGRHPHRRTGAGGRLRGPGRAADGGPSGRGGGAFMISVLVVDDDPFVRDYLTESLAAAGFEVAGTAADGAEAGELASRTQPKVVLLDIRMPGVDGTTATRELAGLDPAPAVILMTALDSDEALLGGLAAGAHGYTTKTAPVEAIVESIR